MFLWIRALSGTSGWSSGAHALVGIVTGSSRPWKPVSSATSRSAASLRDSPMFRRPFGSSHSFVLRRFTRQTLASAVLEDVNSTAPQLSTKCSDACCFVTKVDSAIVAVGCALDDLKADVPPSTRVHVAVPRTGVPRLSSSSNLIRSERSPSIPVLLISVQFPRLLIDDTLMVLPWTPMTSSSRFADTSPSNLVM